jgi:hypothetical protein
LQHEVSDSLFGVLESLVAAPRPDERPVRVNVSLALVRWYHKSHEQRRLALLQKCISNSIEDETFENLKKWVMHWRNGAGNKAGRP